MPDFVSPKELAQAIGASESSLKRWADKGHLRFARTAGGHRRIPVSEAVRFVRARGLTVVSPEVFGFGGVQSVPVQEAGQPAEGLLTNFLMSGQLAEAYSLISSLFLGGSSVAEIADGPIRHAMAEIGELWHHSREGILIEHRATEACSYAVNMIRSVLEVAADAPKAIGCSVQGDPYSLSTLLASVVTCECGFESTNLGVNLPIEVLKDEVDRSSPSLVWISINIPEVAEPVKDGILLVAEKISSYGGILAIGGHSHVQLGLASAPGIAFCGDMQELSKTASWVRAAQSS